MKKALLLGMLLSILTVNSQNFPGENVNLLLGKELKVKERDEGLKKYGYDYFYEDLKLEKKYKAKSKYDNTEYSELAGKTFKVIGIEEYVDRYERTNILLKIESEEIGILFYKYDKKYEHNFEFEVIGGIDFPEGYFCKDLKTKVDKFKNETTINSPYNKTISFIKVKSEGKENTLYMRIEVAGSTANVGKKGVRLLLDNGEKMEWPDAKIDANVNKRGRGYLYSSFHLLNKDDIAMLSQNIITDVRLYVYDKEIQNGKLINEYLTCLLKD